MPPSRHSKTGDSPLSPASSQRLLVIFKQKQVDLINIVNPVLYTILDNQVRLAARGERETGSSEQILRLVQIQVQRRREGEHGPLAGTVGRITADLGKEFPVEVGPLVHFCVGQVPLVDQAKEMFLDKA